MQDKRLKSDILKKMLSRTVQHGVRAQATKMQTAKILGISNLFSRNLTFRKHGEHNNIQQDTNEQSNKVIKQAITCNSDDKVAKQEITYNVNRTSLSSLSKRIITMLSGRTEAKKQALLESKAKYRNNIKASYQSSTYLHNAHLASSIRCDQYIGASCINGAYTYQNDYSQFAQAGYQRNVIVNRAINMIAHAAATTPIKMFTW